MGVIAGIGGAVYYHELRSARADTITAMTDNKKSMASLQNEIKSSKEESQYQEKDIMPDDKHMLITMKNAKKSADSDYYSSSTALYAKDINRLQLGEVKALDERLKADTTRKNMETKTLGLISDSMKKSHRKRLISDAQAHLKNAIQQAKQKLQSSNGNVDDNAARTKLQSLIDSSSKLTSGDDVNSMNASLKDINGTMSAVDADVQSRTNRIAQAQREASARAAAAAAAASYNNTTPQYGSNSVSGGYSNGISSGTAANSTVSINASSSCNGDTSSDACQEYVDRGGFVNISYFNGSSNVYAAHNGLGGRTVLGWQSGQKVNINGKSYTVTNKKYNVQAWDVPKTGTYAQTCDANGQRVLVGLQ
jgi:myosin heavy subunit